MKRSSLITIIVFVAGLGAGYLVRGAMGMLQQKDKHAADLAAIEKLHQKNVEVTLSQDPKTRKGLVDIWTEEG